MKTRRNPFGSAFAETLYFSRQEIDRMCEEALRKAGLLPQTPSAINVELFIEKHFQCSIDYASEIADGVLGYTLFADTGKVLLVGVSPSLDDGTKTGSRRVRSTLAHEAGHCLMHPLLFMKESRQQLFDGHNIDLQQNRILCRKEDFKTSQPSYNGRWWEYQANCAISGFLLPKRLVHLAILPLLTPQGSMGLEWLPAEKLEEAASLLADTFDVNTIVGRIRLQEMFSEKEKPLL